jgi:hypothetical protein
MYLKARVAVLGFVFSRCRTVACRAANPTPCSCSRALTHFAKSLKSLHSGKVKESIWRTEQVHVRFLSPTIAIVHVYFRTSGERNRTVRRVRRAAESSPESR